MWLKKKSIVPGHVGIILDGNRRWAEERKLPTFEGHRQGLDNVETIGRAVFDRGVEVLTVFSLSYENRIEREQEELDYLFDLFREALERSITKFDEDNIRVRFIGRVGWMPEDIQEKAREAEQRTKTNTRGTFIVTMAYSGRDDIVRAVGRITSNAVTRDDPLLSEELISGHLDTSFLPEDVRDPDLVIRTGGRQRLSGFLLWQAAYSELYFSPKLWPDFSESDLDKALKWYAAQKRNFGR